ncbi:MAG: ABC transporter ATP-binding protein [Dehalococcoidia bacterium]|nr:ABC transporter ATP-binding protein [Dehalococcoidia bacterium]
MPPLLEVKNLQTHFITRSGVARAVDGVTFSLERGQTLGLVGESGSGKSVTCSSIVRLLPKGSGRIVGGEVLFEGRNLLDISENEMRRIRGSQISFVTQDPMTSLNPVYSIGNQMEEPLRYHQGMRNHGQLHAKVVEALTQVGIPSPERRVKDYPHQLSGGQRQRVVTAMAIECQPSLLIADEPTTALDVTVQIQILRLLKDVQKELNLGMILVTHDLSVIARTCDKVAVMYAGRIVEEGPIDEIFARPRHPYTRSLMRAIPQIGRKEDRLYSIPGQPPDVRRLPQGCPFAPRCPDVIDRCTHEAPTEQFFGSNHRARCLRAEEMGAS